MPFKCYLLTIVDIHINTMNFNEQYVFVTNAVKGWLTFFRSLDQYRLV